METEVYHIIKVYFNTVFCLLRAPPHSLEEANSTINVQNTCSFLHNCPIFNPKPPLESLESQLLPHNVKCDLANTPGALIRQNTVP